LRGAPQARRSNLKGDPMKGYQFLQNDFFDLCKTREIGRIPQLLYIYLRGLYCRFQKPIFTWQDKKILDHLSISQSTLSRSRQYLQKQGMLKFKSGIGINPTEYTMLGTVLLPVVKKPTRSRQNPAYGYRQIDDTYISIKEREKKRIGIFQGMEEEDREKLRKVGIL